MIENDPLEGIFAYIESAYVRNQAGELLVRCLEDNSTSPIQNWVEGLILAGPESLDILQAIILEVDERKIQAGEELNLVLKEFEAGLGDLGVELPDFHPTVLDEFRPRIFLSLLRDQGVVDERVQRACLQILRDAREVTAGMVDYLILLEEIEAYLQDWLWGLYYQLARQDGNNSSLPAN